MQLPSQKHLSSIAEYIRYENAAAHKHEYRDGEIIAMAGNSFNHSLIAMNIGRVLGNALLGKPCRPLDSNLRIGIPNSARYTYPDLSVICGPPKLDPNDPAGFTATNPRVLIEILSPSTEAYDRGDKFNRYQKIETLEDYVLISQSTARVEIFHRQPDSNWTFTSVSGLDAIARISSVQAELKLADIYIGVEFPPEADVQDEPSK